ncbi:MAG TPA: site-specific DNA-methyltransferase [Iamia sp.]|nr:site-specific DNA-methyltransferase [Iamia sp.]
MADTPRRPRRPTATSAFGVGRRESHDASDFYARFTPPVISDDETVLHPSEREIADPFLNVDAREIVTGGHVRAGSVALVVTSPPYFVGKTYEEEVQRDGVPASYGEYLEMLHQVFGQCVQALEPGGRIAVNVANLGRRPYRSLSGDITGIFEDLGLLLRGEVLWQKSEGSSGNCAWGSFMQPTNPSLRDITERVIIASKGRFDRARSARVREDKDLPHKTTITADLYMESTLDVWKIPAESAKRVGHPAPFPVELPERLIHLYTWVDDLVLDPFMGAGSTLVAAERTERKYVGFDLDPDFVELSRARVRQETERLDRKPIFALKPSQIRERRQIEIPSINDDDDFQARATKEGKAANALAERVLGPIEDGGAGFNVFRRKVRLSGVGAEFNIEMKDADGGLWYVDVSGASFANPRGGLRRTDTLWKALGRADVFFHADEHTVDHRLILLTSHLPRHGSEGDRALRSVGPEAVFDVIAMLDDAGRDRLSQYGSGGFSGAKESRLRPLPGFWTQTQIDDMVEETA